MLFLTDRLINESLPLTEVVPWLRAHGHESDLLVQSRTPRFWSSVRDWRPDLVMIPWDVGNDRWAKRATLLARQRTDALVAVCGTRPSFSERLPSHGADFVFRGEVELPLVAFLQQSPQRGRDPGLPGVAAAGAEPSSPGPLIHDLDQLPMPDRDLYFRHPLLARIPAKRFYANRDCPFACSFCHVSAKKKQQQPSLPRSKSPLRVVEEILAVRRKHPLSFVVFNDDTFTWNHKWVLEFAPLYARRLRLPFVCNTIASFISDEICAALRSAGCRAVAIGVECADEKRRMELLNKPVSDRQIEGAARAIRRHGMVLVTYNILGLPGTTGEDDLRTLDFNRQIGADLARFTVAYPIPGTPLAAHALREVAQGPWTFSGGVFDGNEDTPDLLRKAFPLLLHLSPAAARAVAARLLLLRVAAKAAPLLHAWKELRLLGLSLRYPLQIALKEGSFYRRTKLINLGLP